MDPQTEPLTDFLDCYLNKKTRDNYRIALKHFLKYLVRAKHLISTDDLNAVAVRYIKVINLDKRDPLKDLMDYSVWLEERYAPTTLHLYLRNVVIWLEDNGYRLTRRERRKLWSQLPPPYPSIEGIELKRKTIRSLYYALPSDVGVLLIVLLASGMRLGEALMIKKDDIDWEQPRPQISISAAISKTKTPRITYLTLEAKDALLWYYSHRRDDDPRVFNISYSKAQQTLRDASNMIGCTISLNGKTSGIHWHMTRKWFLSRFSLAASREIAEHLAGHEGYLSRSYRRYTKKQILKHYLQAEKKLSILKIKEF